MNDVKVRQLYYDSGKCFVCGGIDCIVETEGREWVQRECMRCEYLFKFDKQKLNDS